MSEERWCHHHGQIAVWRDDGLGNPRCGHQDRWGCICGSVAILPRVVDDIQAAAVARFTSQPHAAFRLGQRVTEKRAKPQNPEDAEIIAEFSREPRKWPNFTRATMTPALAEFLAWRMDEVFALLIMNHGCPRLDLVADFVDAAAHGLRIHQQGGEPRDAVSPRLLDRIGRISEAYERWKRDNTQDPEGS